MVDSVVILLNDGAKQKKIDVKNSIPEDLLVYADDDMLKFIFRNLITNALKFTNQGGKITIKATETIDFMEIAVIDNGVGISQKKMERLFKIGEQKGFKNCIPI